MDLEIRHARVVTTLFEAGSISKAAGRLGIPQPSLTAQLRRIERMIGGALFVRSRSGLTPTWFGESLIPMLGDLVRQAEAVSLRVAEEPAKTLVIGISECMPVGFHRTLKDSVPLWQVQTITVDPHSAAEWVDHGMLSAALVPVPEDTATTEFIEYELARTFVALEPVWLALPDGHPLADLDVVTHADLAGLTWVGYNYNHWLRPTERRLLADRLPVPPAVVHRAGSQLEAVAWVRDTGVAALVSPTGPARDTSLVAIDDAPTHRLMLLWRPDSLPEAVLRQVTDAARTSYVAHARHVQRYWSWLNRNPDRYLDPAQPV